MLFLSNESNELYRIKNVDEKQIRDDLYKVQSYEWGGGHNNSLDKFLVRLYVKENPCYKTLMDKQKEIAKNAWNYVQASWYNNWTSYLIESFFKKNPKVVSAVGEIKSVDFFIDSTPIDLKVTLFPNKYMDEKFKLKTEKTEIAWLKSKADENKIYYDPESTDSKLRYALIEKFKDANKTKIINEFCGIRKEIVIESTNNPTELIRWLYENQGEMRFGAENRLYLLLVDLSDLEQSWKMKRNFVKIEPAVKKYLNSFNKSSLKKIDFCYKKKKYKSLADILFVINR